MSRAPSTRAWLAIASRVAAATFGGYAAAALLASALAVVLPHISSASRADGVLIASLSGFAFHAAAALWVFSTRSARRAWAGLAGVALACAALLAAVPATG